MGVYKFLLVVESSIRDPEAVAKKIKLHFNSLPWINNIVIRRIEYIGEAE